MRPLKGYNSAKASGDYERLAPGGYVLKITAVKDDTEKQYLQIVYDIAEGPEAGRYANEEPENDYRHAIIRSYKDTALGMLKAFIQAVDETNGTKLGETVEKGLDEQKLVGLIFGAVLGYEEYETNTGEVKQRLYLKNCKTAEEIRKGDFKVPAFKTLSSRKAAGPAPAGFEPIDGDFPF